MVPEWSPNGPLSCAANLDPATLLLARSLLPFLLVNHSGHADEACEDEQSLPADNNGRAEVKPRRKSSRTGQNSRTSKRKPPCRSMGGGSHGVVHGSNVKDIRVSYSKQKPVGDMF
jgi:hypothetical protein